MDMDRHKPLSVLIPLLLSAMALGVVLGHAAFYGVVHEPDEGAAAHVFQLLMTAQLPFLAYFGYKWVRPKPRRFYAAMASLAVLWMGALAGVYFLT